MYTAMLFLVAQTLVPVPQIFVPNEAWYQKVDTGCRTSMSVAPAAYAKAWCDCRDRETRRLMRWEERDFKNANEARVFMTKRFAELHQTCTTEVPPPSRPNP